MSITKQDDGKYLLNIRPWGVKGKQVKKIFKTKQSALVYQRTLATNEQTVVKQDNRTFNELIQLWYISHGVSLKSAEDTRNRLLKISEYFGNPILSSLSPGMFTKYRTTRLNDGISPATLNRELSTLSTLFNELERLGLITIKNPFSNIRKLKQTNTELSYLSQEQIDLLFTSIVLTKNHSLYFVVKLCLSTGSRWSEAENITYSSLKNKGVEYLDTKNGLNRYVPLAAATHQELETYLKQHKKFNSCYSAFRSALNRSGIKTPKGQCSHILRHTFASHFIMNGGNILTLQKILGHSSLNVTTRYAHLAPDFLQEAVTFNPLQFIK